MVHVHLCTSTTQSMICVYRTLKLLIIKIFKKDLGDKTFKKNWRFWWLGVNMYYLKVASCTFEKQGLEE